jgi:hypothetical protein
MPGASDKTQRVNVLNANWVVGGDGGRPALFWVVRCSELDVDDSSGTDRCHPIRRSH